MQYLKGLFFVTIGLASLGGLYFFNKYAGDFSMDPAYKSEIEQFRTQAEERLRSPEGWLSVVGLHWLRPGKQSVGSDASNDIVMPRSAAPKVGHIDFREGNASLEILAPGILVNGVPATALTSPPGPSSKIDLVDDSSETKEPTLIQSGSVRFFVIRRKNGSALRVKDENAEARKNFEGRQWFSAHEKWRISAEWIPFDPPKTIGVPDILGNLNDEISPGKARFLVDGETVELTPTSSGDKLFFIFRDQTGGKETYGAARFLYADAPKDGRLTLDFNKTVNPPCAFTHFATCPMPIRENILKVSIRAGEMKPRSHAP